MLVIVLGKLQQVTQRYTCKRSHHSHTEQVSFDQMYYRAIMAFSRVGTLTMSADIINQLFKYLFLHDSFSFNN